MTGQTPLELSAGAQAILGRPLSSTEAARFNNYLKLLQKWGSIHRLIGSTEPAWIVENLFLDSLLFLKLLPEPLDTLMDLGSGPGVPGVPIKIVRDDLKVTLLESRQRRASFLSTVVRELGLAETTVINARAEVTPADLLGAFDAVVMRCAGDLASVLPLAEQFVRPGGLLVASGPPTPRDVPSVEWRRIPGVRPGTTRAFALRRRPEPAAL